MKKINTDGFKIKNSSDILSKVSSCTSVTLVADTGGATRHSGNSLAPDERWEGIPEV